MESQKKETAVVQRCQHQDKVSKWKELSQKEGSCRGQPKASCKSLTLGQMCSVTREPHKSNVCFCLRHQAQTEWPRSPVKICSSACLRAKKFPKHFHHLYGNCWMSSTSAFLLVGMNGRRHAAEWSSHPGSETCHFSHSTDEDSVCCASNDGEAVNAVYCAWEGKALWGHLAAPAIPP